jgi:hypothetical protein
MMSWFELKGDERLGRCATDECGGQPIYRLEAQGVGSNYCSGCRAKIEAAEDVILHGIGFVRQRADGTAERLPPDEVFIYHKETP